MKKKQAAMQLCQANNLVTATIMSGYQLYPQFSLVYFSKML
jgi:hypothetical protein